jgi:Flp pilus assembly protein TadG
MLSRFRRDCRGTSAVEFALAAPLLAIVFLGIAGGFLAANQISGMRGAVKNGANYVLKGGTDLEAVEEAVKTSWVHLPSSAQVNTSYACTCGTVANMCTALCADGTTVPKKSMTIQASMNVIVPFWVTIDPWVVSHSEVVRVR